MRYQDFLTLNTILIMLCFAAFIFDTAGGVMFAKLVNVLSKKKVNPMVGAQNFGISQVQNYSKVCQGGRPVHFVLMPMVAQIAGQLGSVIAGYGFGACAMAMS